MTSAAISSPWSLIQSLYAADPTLDAFDARVAGAFSSLFSSPETRAEARVPALTSRSTPSSLPKAGTLVKFRAVVQDTGVGSEVYRAKGGKENILMFGIEEEEGTADAGKEDYSSLRERQAFYITSVPGENEWVKETLDGASTGYLDASVAGLSVSDGSPLLSAKYPVPGERHFGCVAKVYGDAADDIKIGDVYEFFGVVSEAPLSNPFEELVDEESAAGAATVPAFHVVFFSAPVAPTFVADANPIAETRQELLAYLSEAVGGDLEAAEWILLACLARIHTRSPITLGSLSLNLSLPANFTPARSLSSVLASILTKSTTLALSIPFLNNAGTRIAPRSRNENLESGALQLSPGTVTVVDTRGIGEGKLEDAGVRNLQHVSTTIAANKLAYQFPYSSFDLDADLGFVVLSEGKAIIPTDCVVYVRPSPTLAPRPSPPSPAQLAAFRAFILTQKSAEFSPPAPTMSEFIQGDFVQRRRDSVGGEVMTQADLLFRMGASRLLALSQGKKVLDEEVWTRMAELDEKRKAAVPATKKA